MSWQPDIDQCTRLLEMAFPDLEITGIDVLGEGWDSVAFLVNDTLVFRLPKRIAVEQMLRRERLVLTAIADRLKTSIPRYEFVADELPGFPSSLGGYHYLRGKPLSGRALADLPIEGLATQIADVLIALHKTDLRAIPGLEQGDADDWWQERWQLYETCVAIIEHALPSRIAGAARSRWEEAFASSRNMGFTPVLVHGDLATDHILLDAGGGLAGLIDFGDAGPGDPAIDLAGLPASLAETVLCRYAAAADERSRLDQRRQFYRLTVPLHAINAGLEIGSPELIDQGIAGLHERFGV